MADIVLEVQNLSKIFDMPRHARFPSPFQLITIHRVDFGQDVGQRFEHHMIVEAAGCLLLRKFEREHGGAAAAAKSQSKKKK